MCGRRGCVTFISHHPGSYFSSILLKRESNIPIIVESSFTEWLKMVLGIKEKFRVIVQLFIFLLKLRINKANVFSKFPLKPAVVVVKSLSSPLNESATALLWLHFPHQPT